MTMTRGGATDAGRADVVVIGGGIAGLWIRAVLSGRGLGVALVERDALGRGQTLASQGIIHRGVKYAFSESAREASGQLAQVADVWARCLAGDGPLDLRSTRVLSDATHLWTTGGVMSSLTAMAASKALRSGVRELDRAEFPSGFVDAPASVRVWRVEEPVVDPGSLAASVRDAGRGAIVRGEVAGIAPDDDGVTVRISPRDDATLRGGDEVRGTSSRGATASNARTLSMRAAAVVSAAGVGNEEMLRLIGVAPESVSQRRPLRMAMVRGVPVDLFGHVPQSASDKPRLTITSGRLSASQGRGDDAALDGARRDGGRLWYLGGNLAERGVELTPERFLGVAREELAACVPWADLSRVRFASLLVDRAEGKTERGGRPDGPVVRWFGRMAAVWPTKLALAPAAAEIVEREVLAMTRSPIGGESMEEVGRSLPTADVASMPWDDPAFEWASGETEVRR
jgi:FAD dependent oxidoreductase